MVESNLIAICLKIFKNGVFDNKKKLTYGKRESANRVSSNSANTNGII